MEVQVRHINHAEESLQKGIYEFLAPYETYCLFIIGNMKRNFPDSHIYLATRGSRWVGVAGYYDGFHSVIPFALDPEAARALIRHVAQQHKDIKVLCAVGTVAAPAYEELNRWDYSLVNDPHCAFMQLDAPPPPQKFEPQARLIAEGDHPAVARLFRYLHGESQDTPLTGEELRLAAVNPSCYVLEIGGEIVSTASTNGMGITAFQILGVSTHPAHRNHGYARAVCAALIRAMWAAGARRCILFTEIHNTAAQACYKKLGFETKTEYWMARVEKSPDAVSASLNAPI
jgi:ribosomal protein S18 acetylase RimI-like enzyme